MKNINNINYPTPQQEYKVLVRCYTYNHSKYIEDALNGFAMQQTNFPFVCVVMDDASTDGEQEVIKGWMERECDMSNAETIDIPTSVVIIVPHKTNVSCTFAFYLLKQNLYRVKGEKKKLVDPWREKCEYEALCEGDDYWIDSLKLQEQVQYLDNQPQVGLCYSQCKYYYQSIGDFASKPWGGKSVTFEELFIQNTIPTATTIFRRNLYHKYLEEINPKNKKWKLGDYSFWLYISKESSIYFFNEVTAVYRVLDESASHSNSFVKSDSFIKSVFDMKSFYCDYFEYNCELNDFKYKSLALNAFRLNCRWETMMYLINIENKTFFVHLLYCITKLPIVFNVCSSIYCLINRKNCSLN